MKRPTQSVSAIAGIAALGAALIMELSPADHLTRLESVTGRRGAPGDDDGNPCPQPDSQMSPRRSHRPS
jgi:hypothetical protein